MTEITFLSQLIQNNPQLFTANSDASIHKLLPVLVKELDNQPAGSIQDNYQILVGFQLTDFNSTILQVIQDLSANNININDLEWEISTKNINIGDLELQPVDKTGSLSTFKIVNKNISLSDLQLKMKSSLTNFDNLNLKNGNYLIVMKTIKSSMSLKVILPNNSFRIFPSGSQILLGRVDREKDIFPDLDLTPYLRNPLRISRRQAWFVEENEKWKIRLHQEASSHVYADNVLLEKNKDFEILDDTEFKFGNDINDPELRIIVSPILNK